jgi:hypothetical protein
MTTKKRSKSWIQIERFQDPEQFKKKTYRWFVYSLKWVVLGEIKWFGRFRQYAFFPANDTVFNPACLRDIAYFCDLQTKGHREGRVVKLTEWV